MQIDNRYAIESEGHDGDGWNGLLRYPPRLYRQAVQFPALLVFSSRHLCGSGEIDLNVSKLGQLSGTFALGFPTCHSEFKNIQRQSTNNQHNEVSITSNQITGLLLYHSASYAQVAKEPDHGAQPPVPPKPAVQTQPQSSIDIDKGKVNVVPNDFKSNPHTTTGDEVTEKVKEDAEYVKKEAARLEKEAEKEAKKAKKYVQNTVADLRKNAQEAWKNGDWRAQVTVLIDVLVVAGVGYFAYEKRDQTWDRRIVSATAVGLGAFYGLQAYLISGKKQK